MSKNFLKIFIFLFIIVFAKKVCAENNLILEQYNNMEIDGIFYAAEEALPEFNSRKIVEMLTSGTAFETENIFHIVINYLFANARELIKICLLIITIGYIISIINVTQESFGGNSTQTAFLVGYCIFAGILGSSFSTVITPAKDAIQMLISMIKTSIPTLLTLLTLGGGINTSAYMSSSLISMINIIALILGEFLISVVTVIVALSVADRMSNRINVTSTVKFLKQFVRWIMIFCMAIYSGIYGVYGLAGTALDSRIGKATKFAVGSSVPIVGGVVSDSIEVVLGTVSAVRSITGIVGIISICALALQPLVKTGMVMWSLRLCAAILEPVSDQRLVQLTSDIADCVSLIFAILVSVSLLLVGCIGIILICGNFLL